MSNKDKFDCCDLEEALREESPERMAMLEAHAKECAACRQELVLWREISEAAHAMRKEWPSPALWPRIAQTLEAEPAKPRGWREWFQMPGGIPALRWQLTFATLALLLLSGVSGWLMLHRSSPVTPGDQHLLTDQAVRDVEKAQQAYEQSIDKLAKLAQPKLDSASTPLMVNYREKLELLNAAIADCRANLEQNQANAYLRRELLSFYQEKQRTLDEVLQGE
jgi:hypothetical protein